MITIKTNTKQIEMILNVIIANINDTTEGLKSKQKNS